MRPKGVAAKVWLVVTVVRSGAKGYRWAGAGSSAAKVRDALAWDQIGPSLPTLKSALAYLRDQGLIDPEERLCALVPICPNFSNLSTPLTGPHCLPALCGALNRISPPTSPR